ncbi:unnamed protein product [Gadus morhua 'NCC']
MASQTEPVMESPRNDAEDPLSTKRLKRVGEMLLTLDNQISLCNNVLEDLQELQSVVLKRNLQDARLPSPK